MIASRKMASLLKSNYILENEIKSLEIMYKTQQYYFPLLKSPKSMKY